MLKIKNILLMSGLLVSSNSELFSMDPVDKPVKRSYLGNFKPKSYLEESSQNIANAVQRLSDNIDKDRMEIKGQLIEVQNRNNQLMAETEAKTIDTLEILALKKRHAEELSKITLEFQNLQGMHEEQLRLVNQLQQEKDSLQKELLEKKSLLESERGDKEQLAGEIEQRALFISELENQIAIFQKQSQENAQSISGFERALGEAQQQIQALQSKLGLKKEKIKGLKGEKSQLQGKNVDLEQSLQETQAQLDEKARGLEGMSRDLKQKEAEYEDLRGLKAELDDRLKRFEAEKTQLELEMGKINEQLQGQQGNNAELQQQLNQHVGQISAMIREMRELEAKKESLDKNYDTSSRALQKLRVKYEFLKAERDALLLKIENFRLVMGSQAEMLEHIMSGKVILVNKEQYLGLDEAITDTKLNNSKLQAENTFLEKQRKVLENEVNLFKEALVLLKKKRAESTMYISNGEFDSIVGPLDQAISQVELKSPVKPQKPIKKVLETSSEEDSVP